jgi:hypothetical protein
VPGWILPPVVAVVNVGAATTAVARVYELNTELETSHWVRWTPPAPVQAAVGTERFVAYRLSR